MVLTFILCAALAYFAVGGIVAIGKEKHVVDVLYVLICWPVYMLLCWADTQKQDTRVTYRCPECSATLKGIYAAATHAKDTGHGRKAKGFAKKSSGEDNIS